MMLLMMFRLMLLFSGISLMLLSLAGLLTFGQDWVWLGMICIGGMVTVQAALLSDYRR